MRRSLKENLRSYTKDNWKKRKIRIQNETIIVPVMPIITFQTFLDGEDDKQFNIKCKVRVMILTNGIEDFIDSENVNEFIEDVLWLEQIKLDDERIEKFSRDHYNIDSGSKWSYLDQTCRMMLENIKIDIDSDVTAYPFNEDKLKFKLSFPERRINITDTKGEKSFKRSRKHEEKNKEKWEKKNDTPYDPSKDEDLIKEGQQTVKFIPLYNKFFPQSAMTIDMSALDGMEVQDPYRNYLGQGYYIDKDHQLHQEVLIQRMPQKDIKSLLIPLLILIFFSNAPKLQGDFNDQLGNLLAIYLAQQQFLSVFNDEIVFTKLQTVADIVNYQGMLMNLLTCLSILQNSLALKKCKLDSDNCFSFFQTCQINIGIFIQCILQLWTHYHYFNKKQTEVVMLDEDNDILNQKKEGVSINFNKAKLNPKEWTSNLAVFINASHNKVDQEIFRNIKCNHKRDNRPQSEWKNQLINFYTVLLVLFILVLSAQFIWDAAVPYRQMDDWWNCQDDDNTPESCQFGTQWRNLVLSIVEVTIIMGVLQQFKTFVQNIKPGTLMQQNDD